MLSSFSYLQSSCCYNKYTSKNDFSGSLNKTVSAWSLLSSSPAFLPLIIADGSYDPQDEGPAGAQAVSLALQNLQDALQLFLPDVCM